jgi:alkanesulfonate monooxygenase SsuD/methylene tetrahydromethanopterin reductase-like flavin-dependent oxidoreductase (luciferase family)
VKVGIHLPLMEFGGEGQSLRRLVDAVDAARDCGLDAVSANDHFLFSTPWLDGLTALAAVAGRTGEMTLATTIALSGLRSPVMLAKSFAALDILCEGRLVAGVGPGSSKADYDAVGLDFGHRWPRFDSSVEMLRALLRGEPPPESAYFPAPEEALEPGPSRDGGVPIWIGSWGSQAGLARVARLADGWLASAYNTTPDGFAEARQLLAEKLAERGRDPDGFPNAVVTMWTWVSEDRGEVEGKLERVLAPLLRRDPAELAAQVCVGSAEHCAELLSRYSDAGCEWVQLWPLGDEPRQIQRLAADVLPELDP